MTSSWWQWYEWAWTAASLVMVLAVLAAAVVALRKLGGLGARVLLLGGLVELTGWMFETTAGFFPSFSAELWWSFFMLGLWTFGSLLVTVGIILVVMQAGGMKERLMSLEAIVREGA